MQLKKRKHQKVDPTKHKVQYLVEVPLQTTQIPQELIKKSPQLVKVEYENTSYMQKNNVLNFRGKLMFDFTSPSERNPNRLKQQQKQEQKRKRAEAKRKLGKFRQFDEEQYHVGNQNIDQDFDQDYFQ